MATIIPRPAQPVPGSGPPASMQRTPRLSVKAISPEAPVLSWSRTVGMRRPIRLRVESALGSQPTTATRFPAWAMAAARLDTAVDFPMPPFP